MYVAGLCTFYTCHTVGSYTAAVRVLIQRLVATYIVFLTPVASHDYSNSA